MRSFEYCAPASISEAVAVLAEKGERARPLAGGTELLVQRRQGLLDLDLVVDVKKIPEMSEITFSPSKGLTIGAAVPCCRVYEHSDVVEHYPGLVDAASIIGGIAIQGRASMGGNLCNAAPSGDCIPALIVLGAACTIAGPFGNRIVPVECFCTAPGQTVLNKGEMLVSMHLPIPQPNSGARYLRFIPRNEMDLAVAGVGASVVLSEDHETISAARIALGAVAPTPLFASAPGKYLIGKVPSEEVVAEAATLAQQVTRPISDVRGTAAQRRHLAGVLTKRALRGAIVRAKGGQPSGPQN